MARYSKKGVRPIAMFVPCTETKGTNSEGKEVIYKKFEARISTGRGYGITLYLPDDTPCVSDNKGIKGAWINFYVNRPKKKYSTGYSRYPR